MNRFPLFVLAVASFLPSPAPASAQRSISLWGGVNATWREDTSFPHGEQELDALRRIAVGATARFPTRGRVGVRLGVGYSRKGSLVRRTFANGDLREWTREADYLDMTMLGSLGYAPPGSRFSLHLLAGPFLSFPVSSCTRNAGREYASDTCQGTQLLAPIDLGMAAGGGIDLRLTARLDITMDLLYSARLVYSDGHQVRHAETYESMRSLALHCGMVYNFFR